MAARASTRLPLSEVELELRSAGRPAPSDLRPLSSAIDKEYCGRTQLGSVCYLMTRPEPVRDLDIEPKRARALLDAASDLYQEYLERLPDLPIDRHLTSPQVRDLVTIDIPEVGMS